MGVGVGGQKRKPLRPALMRAVGGASTAVEADSVCVGGGGRRAAHEGGAVSGVQKRGRNAVAPRQPLSKSRGVRAACAQHPLAKSRAG